jgi:hypothetical protein
MPPSAVSERKRWPFLRTNKRRYKQLVGREDEEERPIARPLHPVEPRKKAGTPDAKPQEFPAFRTGAGNGIRTRDPQLGKLMLYQLSYSRETPSICPEGPPLVKPEPPGGADARLRAHPRRARLRP